MSRHTAKCLQGSRVIPRHAIECWKGPRQNEFLGPLFHVAVNYSASPILVVVTLDFAYVNGHLRPTKVNRGEVIQNHSFSRFEKANQVTVITYPSTLVLVKLPSYHDNVNFEGFIFLFYNPKLQCGRVSFEPSTHRDWSCFHQSLLEAVWPLLPNCCLSFYATTVR